jgi:hypothetical protein
LLEEGVALANEKSAMHWKALGMIGQGCLLSLATTNFSDAAHITSAGIAEHRSTGATVWLPLILSHLARAKAEVGHFDDALRCLDEAMTAIQTTVSDDEFADGRMVVAQQGHHVLRVCAFREPCEPAKVTEQRSYLATVAFELLLAAGRNDQISHLRRQEASRTNSD